MSRMQFNLGWKLSLVLKGRSSPKLLDSYNAERLPVITEMLGRTTELLNKTTAGTGAGKDADVSAWRRGGALHS
jgi:2-polyprenyl-6-methoxyphenol hydroxylase-like FAD-dependent oxidoreductase